jgi:hypothetical protein
MPTGARRGSPADAVPRPDGDLPGFWWCPSNGEVDAETAFEAAALALKFWRRRWSTRHYVKGPGTRAVLEVKVDRPARRLVAVNVSTLLDWLYERTPKTPEEAARIQRLRGLLADARH